VSLSFRRAFLLREVFEQFKSRAHGFPKMNRETSEDEEVIHNIRFEVVTEKNDEDDGKKRKVGNWKIIDIDDLLDGNVFH